MGLLRFCVIQAAMDLFVAMFAKGLILGAWAVVSELIWPENPEYKSIFDKEGRCYCATQRLLSLSAPKDAASAARLSPPLKQD